jgi:hypothetical protein
MVMPGPRKVRVFRDRKKSPNWYVEWRDGQGQRRTESCGPDRADAEQRAQQIREELLAARIASNKKLVAGSLPAIVTNLVRMHAVINLGEYQVPVEISFELTKEVRQALRRTISDVNDIE